MIDHIIGLIETRIALVKIEVKEEVSKVTSRMIVALVMAMLAFFIWFFISFAMALRNLSKFHSRANGSSSS